MITLLAAIVGFTTGHKIAGVALKIRERAQMGKRYNHDSVQ